MDCNNIGTGVIIDTSGACWQNTAGSSQHQQQDSNYNDNDNGNGNGGSSSGGNMNGKISAYADANIRNSDSSTSTTDSDASPLAAAAHKQMPTTIASSSAFSRPKNGNSILWTEQMVSFHFYKSRIFTWICA